MLDILLVDDEPLIRLSLGDALKDAGYTVTLAADGGEAQNQLERRTFDLVISDIRLPKVDGLTLFKRIRSQWPDTDVILITAYGEVSDAVGALNEGAKDYLTKPFDTQEILLRVSRIAEVRQLRRDLAHARSGSGGGHTRQSIIGRSAPMLRLFDRVDAFAGTDASVMITGESGTGKELVARALHEGSDRASRPFVAVNCAAFPETLLEAELFGHEQGAFTGATRRREGRFQAADRGTLFLDEVAEIPLQAQAKLLRVLQERSIEPLGANRAIKVDVRIISATHRDLKAWIADGRFREDLYYRLNVLELPIPPLRDREGDLPLLVDGLLRRLARGEDPPPITDRALLALSAFPFPGNVRELEHALQHGLVLARGGPIEVHHLPTSILGRSGAAQETEGPTDVNLTMAEAVKGFERQHIIRVLKVVSGKRGQAADKLGISRKNLWEKMKAYAITDEEWSEA